MNAPRTKAFAALALLFILTACSSPSPTVTPVPTLAAPPTVDEIRLTNEAVLATNAAVKTAVVGTATAAAGQTATALIILVCATPPPDILTPELTWTPTASSLPDLVVNGMAITLETGDACNYTSTQLGVRVRFQNIGGTDAGPFVVEVDGVQQAVSGLSAGQAGDLWFPGYAHAGENTAFVDATFQVAESDEDNNQLAQRVPIPTLPPTCTPIPAGGL